MEKNNTLIILLTNTTMLLSPLLLKVTTSAPTTTHSEFQTVCDLIELLGKVDEHRFGNLTGLANGHLDFGTIFDKILYEIVGYLLEVELKKLQHHFLLTLKQKKQVCQLVNLTIFILVNSHLRSQTIQTILTLPNTQQQHLMFSLKTIQSKCFHLVQMKDVISTMSSLQLQNHRWKEQEENKMEQLERNYRQVQEIDQQNIELERQNRQYRNNKNAMLKQCDFMSMDEYVYHCLNLKRNINQLSSTVQDQIQQKQHLDNHNKKLKKQLQQCTNTIKHQMEEIQRLKHWHQLLKEQSLLNSENMVYEAAQHKLAIPLGENININNSYTKSNLKIANSTARTYNTEQRDGQQSFDQPTTIQFQLQLHLLQQQQLQKNSQLQLLKHQCITQKQKNKHLSSKIQQLRKSHQHHMQLYTLTSLKQ